MPWDSTSLIGRTTLVFYLDPDKKDLNLDVRQAVSHLNKEGYDFNVLGIMNMDATWIPNFAIDMELEKEQKLYPDVKYIKDFQKELIKKWSLLDDEANVLLFNKKAKLIYVQYGKINQKNLQTLISLLKKHNKN